MFSEIVPPPHRFTWKLMFNPRPLTALKVQALRVKIVLMEILICSNALTVASVRLVIIVTAKDPVSLVPQVLKKELKFVNRAYTLKLYVCSKSTNQKKCMHETKSYNQVPNLL